MTDLERLREIKRIILERGWCRGTPMDDDGRVCFLGAHYLAVNPNFAKLSPATIMIRMMIVGEGGYDTDEVQRGYAVGAHVVQAAKELGQPSGEAHYGLRPVHHWNDSCRSVEEVIEAIDRAILNLELEALQEEKTEEVVAV